MCGGGEELRSGRLLDPTSCHDFQHHCEWEVGSASTPGILNSLNIHELELEGFALILEDYITANCYQIPYLCGDPNM